MEQRQSWLDGLYTHRVFLWMTRVSMATSSRAHMSVDARKKLRVKKRSTGGLCGFEPVVKERFDRTIPFIDYTRIIYMGTVATDGRVRSWGRGCVEQLPYLN